MLIYLLFYNTCVLLYFKSNSLKCEFAKTLIIPKFKFNSLIKIKYKIRVLRNN